MDDVLSGGVLFQEEEAKKRERERDPYKAMMDEMATNRELIKPGAPCPTSGLPQAASTKSTLCPPWARLRVQRPCLKPLPNQWPASNPRA